MSWNRPVGGAERRDVLITPSEARDFAWRVALFYAVSFGLLGLFVPYFPIWLEWRGLTAGQIAAVLAIPLFVRSLSSPVIGFIADHAGDHRLVLRGLCWGSLVSLSSMWFLSGFPAILVVSIAFSIFWTSVTPMTETVAMAGVRAAGLDYGRIRLWGSVAYMAVNYAGGLAILSLGPPAILPFVIAAAAVSALVVELLPRPRGLGRLRAATTAPRITWRDASALLKSPAFLLFLTVAATIQASHAMMYAFGSLIWQHLGFRSSTIGLLWATGVFAEVMLFAFASPIVRRLGIARLFGLAGLAAVLRWTVMAFNPPLALVFVLQAMHGITFGAAHVGAIAYMTEEVQPELTATAQGLYGAVVGGIALGLMTALCGPLYGSWKSGAFLAMALVSAAGFFGSLMLAGRGQPQSARSAGKTVAPS